MKTFDDEQFILDNYRTFPTFKIKYFGRFFHCFIIEKITKSFLFSKSWINSSSKDALPPDFHNNKYHTMMEFMRIDDCINELNGKHIPNSFEKTNNTLKKLCGNNYKKVKNNSMIYFIPNTLNSDEYNFKGYFNNFQRVIIKHSKKVEKYRQNYPKCKKMVFFVCDESNNYVQVSNKEDLNKEDEKNLTLENFKIHYCFYDKKFIDVIKNCNADYVIWMYVYKCLYINGKKIKYPMACIYDVKHIKNQGYIYNHDLMFKVKDEVGYNNY